MEYKQNKTNSAYSLASVIDNSDRAATNDALEKIASSYTRMLDARPKEYNIDKCNCGNCGCIQGNLLLVLSPAGIATTVSAFGPISAMS